MGNTGGGELPFQQRPSINAVEGGTLEPYHISAGQGFRGTASVVYNLTNLPYSTDMEYRVRGIVCLFIVASPNVEV